MTRLINYVTSGLITSQPILIAHGLFGSYKNWNTIIKALSSDYFVIAVDLRNHGDSFNDSEMSYEVMANDIYRLLTHLKLTEVIMIGHSMGGKVAMQLADLHPSLLRQIVIVDIAPIAYTNDHEEILDPIINTHIDNISNRKEVDNSLKKGIPNDFLRLFLLQALAKNKDGWYWKNAWIYLKSNLKQISSALTFHNKIKVPSLFIFGSSSSYFNETAKQSIEKHFSNFKLFVIEDADHWLHYQQPKQFLQLLDKNLL